jgi:hypothetical protein
VEEESAGTGECSQFKALFADAHQWRFDVVLFYRLLPRGGAAGRREWRRELGGIYYKSVTSTQHR